MVRNFARFRFNSAFLLLLSTMLCIPGQAATQKNTARKPASPPKTTGKAATAYTVARDPYLGAIVVDANSGKVLFERGSTLTGHPASVLKLMDLLIILERIRNGQLSLQDQVPVSAKAARTGESQVWLAEKESFTVEEMLYALMVRSANDVAVALAEKVAGSTDAFIVLMNKKAQELGMTGTVFRSVHGLPPSPGQQHDTTNARDLAILSLHLLKYPEALRYTSTRVRPFRPNAGKHTVVMRTHNHLLARVEGCDGLKTGYTARAGFSIAATAIRNGKRLVVVVLGSPSYPIRDKHAAELIERGFATLNAAAASPKK